MQVLSSNLPELKRLSLHQLLQFPALFHWVAESDAVFAALLSAQGKVLAGNPAAGQIFRGGETRPCIADFLVKPDADLLMHRLTSGSPPTPDPFLVNFASAQQNPLSAHAVLVQHEDEFLLIGAFEQRFGSLLQEEMLDLTNRLAVLTRELNQRVRELEEKNRMVEHLARIDDLSGLQNRKTFFQHLTSELVQAKRTRKPLALIMLDLDSFKKINDRRGHLGGDRAIEQIGRLIRECCRTSDLAARYGGDEFVLLLPGSDITQAAAIAERVRSRVEASDMPQFGEQITVSLGVASYNFKESEEELIARADQALYQAKQGGRNCVCQWSGQQARTEC